MKQGYQLEKDVKAAVEALVRSGRLGLNPDCCRVFHNKGYFSKDRGSEIKVDVSIELIPPGTSEPSLIWIWECKDYVGSVPVDDIEEFHAKLEQIGADRTKGTMITRGRYQESTIKYATAKGIGLTRLVDGSRIRIESRPGLYHRALGSSFCRRILSHKIEDFVHLNGFAPPLDEVSDRYFFGLTFNQQEIYSGHLDSLVARQIYELRDEFLWLHFPKHPREL